MSFPLYLDENVNPIVAILLRRKGFDVLTAKEAGLSQQGIPDEVQLEFATTNRRVLITHDREDFGPICRAWYEAGRSYPGVIVLPQLLPGLVADRVSALAAKYPNGIPELFLYA